jgi:8-oxo-dGTP diphosphatase
MNAITEVAVAILLKPDGGFLLSSRPAGKPYAGYWEFPGGKLEAGESVRAALVRELREELNINITAAMPWFTFLMHYSHATVRLHCWRVQAWVGEMRAMEGQEFAWQTLGAMDVAPTLPGCLPIFRALALPAVYMLSNAAEQGAEAWLLQLDVALQNGVRLVQVREKSMAGAELRDFAAEVVARGHANGAKVLINGEVGLATALGADGVHLGSAQLARLAARPDLPLVAASVHTRDELARAALLQCDFAVLGAVKATLTHPQQAPLGWHRFAQLVEASPLPCYALGGLGIDDLATAIEHGAHGVAMQRGQACLNVQASTAA